MAGIDKTYVTNYNDWKEIVDWMSTASFTCPNGMVIEGKRYIYWANSTKEEIEDWLSASKEIPVMNTPTALDYFLIKYCPIKVVQDRMKEVYSTEFYESVKNGTSKYDNFVRPIGGKHVTITKKPTYNYPHKWYNAYQHKYRNGMYSVDITYPNEYEGFAEYNEDYDMFIMPYELGYCTSSGSITTKCRSVKAIINKIIKWNLPIGTKVHVMGMYDEEDFDLIVNK